MYRMRQRVIAVKVEAANGSEETPAVASDAIKAENIRVRPVFPPVDTNEHQDGLDRSDPQFAAGHVEINFAVNFRGAATPGTDPPVFDPILQAAGLARTDVSAAVTGTAQAGAANTITLASGASATNNTYRGMPIQITGGTGSGQWNFITGYVGSTKVATVLKTWGTNPDNTSEYSIPAGSRYAPASQGLKTVSARVWDKEQSSAVNARLFRGKGMSALIRFSLDPHNFLKGEVTLRGMLAAAPANVSDPGAVTYSSLKPPIYNAAETILGATVGQVGNFSFDLGNQVELPDNADETYGFDASQIVDRAIVGGMTPRLGLLSARDYFGDWLAGTGRGAGIRFGTAAGSRVALIIPDAMATDVQDAEVRGFTHHDVQFKARGVDSGVFLYFY